MNKDTIVAHNDYELKPVGTENMLFSNDSDVILILNDFGKDILEFLSEQGSVSIGSIILHFSALVNIETSVLEADIISFLRVVITNGFVRIVTKKT